MSASRDVGVAVGDRHSALHPQSIDHRLPVPVLLPRELLQVDRRRSAPLVVQQSLSVAQVPAGVVIALRAEVPHFVAFVWRSEPAEGPLYATLTVGIR